MTFNFSEVLTRAWQIIWKHKVLWIFGIFAGCGQGGGSGGGGGGNTGFDTQAPDLPPQVMQWLQWVEENLSTFILLLCVFIVLLWFIAKAIGVIGKTGLIHGASQVEGGTEKLVFGQLFSESIPYFWRMFGLSIIPSLPILIPIVAIFVAAVITLLGPNVNNGGVLPELSLLAVVGPLAVVCACLLVPVIIVLYLVIYQSERAVVLENLNFMVAISRGWQVFRGNLGPVIIIAIILLIMNFVINLVIAIPIFLLVFPTVFAYAFSQGESFAPLVFMGICLCIYVPVALVAQGIVTAYTESVWTLTYLRLTRPQESSPVVLEENA